MAQTKHLVGRYASAFGLASLLCYSSLSLGNTLSSSNLGNTGIVHFRGALLASTCTLTPDSQQQIVDLGDIEGRQLLNIGDRSTPVPFKLSFTHCLIGAYGSVDSLAGQPGKNARSLYLSGERAASLTFTGESDWLNNELLALSGLMGVGLRLQDEQGNNLVLNQVSYPYVLQPGDNTLWFKVSLESTRRAVMANSFAAVLNIKVNYL